MELDGYFDGFLLAHARDIGNAGISFARSALIRLIRVPERGRAPFPRDKPLAKVYEALGRLYLRFGDWKLAADCYEHASAYWLGGRDGRRTYSILILCRLMAGDRAGAAELLEGMGPGAGTARHFLRIARALADTESDLRPEVVNFPSTRAMGAAVHGYLVSAAAGRLAGDGHLDQALDLLDTTLRYLDSEPADGWVVADLQQRKASVLLALGRYEQCRQLALTTWAFLDSSRYQACSHTQRRATWRYFAPSRHAALRASIALDDGRSVGELIENCRLQSVIAAEVEAEVAGGKDPLGDIAQVSDQAGEDSPQDHLHAGESIFAAMNDAFNATLLRTPNPVAYNAIAHPAGAFWSTHIENGMLFWFLAVDSRHVGHGMSDLRDHENLQPVLRALAGSSESSDPRMWSLPPYLPQPGEDYEPVQHLADWRSPEEQIISTTIGRLMPDPLVALLDQSTRAAPLDLTIAAARELTAVPWPIAMVPGTEDRLIERAVLRMWTAGAIENERAARPQPPPGAAAPFLLACDNPDGTLRDRTGGSIPSQARVRLHGAAATKEALTEALRDIGSGTPGLFFYTGHAVHDLDPAWSALPLAGDDAVLAGEFFGTMDDGTPFVPMPSRVILSCCSSSGSAMLGGETIGLAAAIIRSGARHVIATGVDVFDSSFTQAFDEILIEGMLVPDADAGVLLRAAQLRMLTEWKTYSLRGGTDYADDFKDPHPIIWAAYQAF